MRPYTRAPAPMGGLLSRRILLGGAAATVMLLGAAGCGRPRNSPAPGGSGGRVTKLTYLTSFGYFGRDSYVFVAKDLGYFAEAGLDVTIAPGNGAGDLVTRLSAGSADACAIDLTGLLLHVSAGKADNLTAVAAIQQRSLAGIMSLEGRGISGPRDLEGRSIGDTEGSVNKLLFGVYAKLAGVDSAKVRWVNIPGPQLPANLASGTVDAVGQFVVGRPTIEKAAAGRKAVVLPYNDYLTDLSGNVLAVTRTLANQQPDVVVRLRDALLKGLAYALEHPDKAGEILHRNAPIQDAAVAAAELRLMAPYVRPTTPGLPSGGLDERLVARNIAILQGASAIRPGITPDQFISFDLAPRAPRPTT